MKKANMREIKVKKTNNDAKKFVRIAASLLLPPVETVILIVDCVKEHKQKKFIEDVAQTASVNEPENLNVVEEVTSTESAQEKGS